jgi:hypothetical protein
VAKATGESAKTPAENVEEVRLALASLADRSRPPDKVRPARHPRVTPGRRTGKSTRRREGESAVIYARSRVHTTGGGSGSTAQGQSPARALSPHRPGEGKMDCRVWLDVVLRLRSAPATVCLSAHAGGLLSRSTEFTLILFRAPRRTEVLGASGSHCSTRCRTLTGPGDSQFCW